MPGWPLITWILIAALYASPVVASILRGRAQRREVGASWRRLVAMAFLLSTVPLLPIAVAWCMGTELDTSWAVAHRVMTPEEVAAHPTRLLEGATFDAENEVWLVPHQGDHHMYLSPGVFAWLPMSNLAIVALACFVGISLVAGLFMPVWRLGGERVECVPVEDEEVLARTEELADRIGAPRPRVLQCPTLDGSLRFNAMVGGTLAPVMIVTDGILQRMEDRQTAGVLAHELGHLARGHPHRAILPMIVVIALAPVLSSFLFPTVCVVLVLLLLRGSRRILGRREELACDRLAGLAVGFVPAAQALDKIHGAQTFDCGPTLGRIVHAMLEHPSRDQRLHHLASLASEAERAEIVHDADEAASQQRMDRRVLLVFAGVVVFGVVAGRVEALKGYGIAAMLALFVGSIVLPYCAFLPRLRYLWQLRPYRVPWRVPLRVLIVVGVICAIVVGLSQPYGWPSLAGVVIGAFLVWRRWRKRRTLVRIYRAVRDQDFAAALEHCGALPKHIRRGAINRLYRATLHAALGEDERAIQELDSLVADCPRFYNAQLLRATVSGWSDPAAGLAIATSVSDALPANPYAMAHKAAHLRKTDDPDAAVLLAREAIRLLPAAGQFYGILAGALCKRGDLDECERQLREYEARDPGATDLLVYRGHLLLARGELEAAREMTRRARGAIEANLMSLLMHALEQLEAALEQLEAACAEAEAETAVRPSSESEEDPRIEA